MYDHVPQELYGAAVVLGESLVSSHPVVRTQNDRNAVITPRSTPVILSETLVNGSPVCLFCSDPGPAIADPFPIPQDVHVAQFSSGKKMPPFQSNSAGFEAAKLPAVPSGHQVRFGSLSESTRV